MPCFCCGAAGGGASGGLDGGGCGGRSGVSVQRGDCGDGGIVTTVVVLATGSDL